MNRDSKIINFAYTVPSSELLYHSSQQLVFDPSQMYPLHLYAGGEKAGIVNKDLIDSVPTKNFLINNANINFDIDADKEAFPSLKDVRLSEETDKRQPPSVVWPNTTIIDPYNTYLYLDPAKLLTGYLRITYAHLFIPEDIRRVLLHFLGERREFQIIQMEEVKNDPTHDILGLCIKEKKVASSTYHTTNMNEIYVGFISKKHYHAWQQKRIMHKGDYQIPAYYLRISNRERVIFIREGQIAHFRGYWVTNQHIIRVSTLPNTVLHDPKAFLSFDTSTPQKPLQKLQFISKLSPRQIAFSYQYSTKTPSLLRPW